MSPRLAQRALSASAFALVARVLRAATRIVTVVFIARWYDDATVAHFSYAFVVGSFLGLLSDAGISEYLVRELGASGGGQGALRRAAFAFRGWTLPVALCVGFGVTHVRYSDAVVSLGGVGLALACSIADMFAAIRRGEGRFALDCFESTPPIAAVAASLCVGALGGGPRAFHLALAVLAWGYIVVRLAVARWSSSAYKGVPFWRPATESRWFFAKGLITWGLFEANVVLLEHLGDERSLATYAIASRPIGLLSLPMAAIGLVFLPALSRTYSVDRERFGNEVLRLNLIHLTMLPAALGLCVGSGEVIFRLAGMTEGRDVLVVLAAGNVAYMGMLSGIPFSAMRNERLLALIATAGTVTLLVCGSLLIPRYGALGAAWASLIAFGLTKLIYVGMYRRLGLPLGDVWHLAAGVLALGYVFALATLQHAAYYVVLSTGILISLAVTVRLMARTRLFEKQA